MEFDSESLKAGFSFLRNAIGLVKDVKGVLPEEKQKVLTATMEQAELNFGTAEAEIAKGLGYHLCQCTFPPQIMLSVGYRESAEYFKCGHCGKEYPPPELPLLMTY